MSSAYGFGKQLDGINLDQGVERVTAALKTQGFGVLTEIDVKATFKKKLDLDFHPYKILGACNPKLAHQALGIDNQVGLLLPCNVVVQAQGEGVYVSFINPMVMGQVSDNPEMAGPMSEADQRLRAVMKAL